MRRSDSYGSKNDRKEEMKNKIKVSEITNLCESMCDRITREREYRLRFTLSYFMSCGNPNYKKFGDVRGCHMSYRHEGK